MKAHTRILALLLIAGGLILARDVSAQQAAKPAPAPATAPAKPAEPKLEIVNFVSLSPMYYYHDYKEKDLDNPTANNGNETGGILGGSVEYIIHLYNPNVFFGAGGFFSDSKTTPDLQMWDGERNKGPNQTENMFLLGQILVGYTFDLSKEFTLDVSTGIGLRAWNRKFLVPDKSYADETYVFFTPYNLTMQLTLMDKIVLGLDGTIRLLFNGSDKVNLTDFPPIDPAQKAYMNPVLLMASDISYRVGIIGRYIFQDKKDEKNFFAVRSITINPYLDHWATGQSNLTYVYYANTKPDGTKVQGSQVNILPDPDGDEPDENDEWVIIKKWSSTTNAWGLRITLDLFF